MKEWPHETFTILFSVAQGGVEVSHFLVVISAVLVKLIYFSFGELLANCLRYFPSVKWLLSRTDFQLGYQLFLLPGYIVPW